MPRRPNYRFERAERDRTKQARKEEKLKRQQERVSQRDGADAEPGDPGGSEQSPGTQPD